MSGITNIINYSPPFTLPEFAQIIGAIGSFILTGGLVYLYLRQTRILEEEQKQTEFQSKALLRVEDFRLLPPEAVQKYAEKKDKGYWEHLIHADLIEVELSNFGRAPANELRIEAMLHGDEFGWESQGALIKGTWTTAAKKLSGRSIDTIRLNDRGAPIGSDERNITYTVSLHATREEIEDQWGIDIPIKEQSDTKASKFLSASEILSALHDLGEQEVDVGLRIWYRDGTGERNPINLQFATAKSPKITDLNTAILQGKPMMPDDIPNHEKWWE